MKRGGERERGGECKRKIAKDWKSAKKDIPHHKLAVCRLRFGFDSS